MKDPTNTGLIRIWRACGNSLKGMRAAIRYESAFRQEAALCLVLIPVACWLGSNVVEIILLIGSCLLVLATELMNSAVEAAIDRIGLERHELSGRAKDLGSAAVFVMLGLALLTWGLIAWSRFMG